MVPVPRIFPEHVRFPVSPARVQPVEVLPPVRFSPTDPTAAPRFIVVAVVSKRLSVVALVFMVGALRESIPPAPLLGERLMFPVVSPPTVRVLLRTLWIEPSPLR